MEKEFELMQAHNEKLKLKNIPFEAINAYVTGVNNPRQYYRCKKGHEFEADRSRTIAGKTKCPKCPGGNRRRTHEAYEMDLMEINSPFYPIEPYKGVGVKIKHKCINDHVHEIEPKRVLQKTNGCPYCSGMIKKTTESYKAELLAKGIRYSPVEEYTATNKKIKHKCYVCDHVWAVMPQEILKGSGCPSCAKIGFNSTKPAILYYIKVWDSRHTYYKIGVTNKTVKQRLQNLGKEYKVLLEKNYDLGSEALAAEQMILEEYKDCKIYAPQFLKTGYTELFEHDVLLLDGEIR